jgi:hypothetical protein
MRFVAACRQLASACAALFGPWGAVSALARQRGQSRQAVYRDTDHVLDAVAGDTTQARLAELEQALAAAQARLGELEQRLAQAVEVTADVLAEFASAAQAEGTSLPQAWRLLRVLLKQRTPCVAQLGVYAAQAARRAAALLPVLDEAARSLVTQGAADEIFCGPTPIVMLVEPESLCWLAGRRVAHRDGATWAAEFRRWSALTYVVSDAGSGLAKGLKLVNQERQQARQATRAHGLDVFHTQREGGRALRRLQGQALAAIDAAAERQAGVERDRRQGQSVKGRTGALGRAWRRAEAAVTVVAAAELAWAEIVGDALALFRRDGRLNDRASAAAVVQRCLPRLAGPAWAKLRRWLQRPETFTFLDRVQERLQQLELAPATLAAVLEVDGLEQQLGQLPAEAPAAVALRGRLLVRQVQLAKSLPHWPSVAAAVRRVLANAWRASSLVDGINSVLRMHQGRHRRLTQGLLDLKRLYWNCRAFRVGRRKRQSPYQRLGLALPDRSWWDLLKLTPEQLRQHLSGNRVAA